MAQSDPAHRKQMVVVLASAEEWSRFGSLLQEGEGGKHHQVTFRTLGSNQTCSLSVLSRSITLLYTHLQLDSSQEDMVQALDRSFSSCSGGTTSFLLLLQGGSYTRTQRRMIEVLQVHFGAEVLKHLLLLSVEDGRVSDPLDEDLLELIHTCEGRYFRFTSSTSSVGDRVQLLLEMMLMMDQSVGGYTRTMLTEARLRSSEDSAVKMLREKLQEAQGKEVLLQQMVQQQEKRRQKELLELKEKHEEERQKEAEDQQEHQERREGLEEALRSQERREGLEEALRSQERREGLEEALRNQERRDGLEEALRSQERREGLEEALRSQERREGLEEALRNQERREGLEEALRSHRDSMMLHSKHHHHGEDLEQMSVVLLGLSGSGKSSALNLILGRFSNRGCEAPPPPTLLCQRKVVAAAGRELILVDTPELWDEDGSENLDLVKDCLALALPGPHVFLVVLQVGRFTQGESRMLARLQRTFGRDFWEHAGVLFVWRGPPPPRGIDGYVAGAHAALQDAVRKCGSRYYELNTEASQNALRSPQLRDLLTGIRKLVASHGGGAYSSRRFSPQELEERREGMEERREGMMEGNSLLTGT